jgi:hypothetical protein
MFDIDLDCRLRIRHWKTSLLVVGKALPLNAALVMNPTEDLEVVGGRDPVPRNAASRAKPRAGSSGAWLPHNAAPDMQSGTSANDIHMPHSAAVDQYSM